MLSTNERLEIIELAEAEIKATLKKHGVTLTIFDGEISLHHGDWHGNGDYSVVEVSLDKECTL